ncbi:DUF2798 domain-containing protein [Comamonas aquatica]|uniref:DUF2798 domain-containing protein n=1 Tax=Comamonas aquatica TaxID=225991 RepID=UPI0021B0AC35|nr:DUF2798 domain-containing protein [Comamonas aquatica]MDH0370518.1 DUF2798 domain-containing protein [Comamonas aquatica]
MSTPSPYIVGRIPKLPPKYALIVMPLLMSGMMSGIICMVNLVRALGWSRAALAAWPGTWLLAWAVAFPTVLLVIPVVKRITGKLVRLS